MVTFSGILYQRSDTPAYLKWLESVSIVNHGVSAILATQSAVLPAQASSISSSLIPLDGPTMTYSGFSIIQIMDSVLKFCEVDADLTRVYIARLCIVIGSLYLLAYVVLRLRLALVSQSL